MIKVQNRKQMRASTRRAVESAIERSKMGKTQSWRDLIKNGSDKTQSEDAIPRGAPDSQDTAIALDE
jgi:hypothetical protein